MEDDSILFFIKLPYLQNIKLKGITQNFLAANFPVQISYSKARQKRMVREKRCDLQKVKSSVRWRQADKLILPKRPPLDTACFSGYWRKPRRFEYAADKPLENGRALFNGKLALLN